MSCPHTFGAGRSSTVGHSRPTNDCDVWLPDQLNACRAAPHSRLEKLLRAVTHAPGVLESPKKPASKNVVYGRGVDCRVLGPVEVLSEGSACALGGPKQRAVIAVLAAAAGRPVSVDA